MPMRFHLPPGGDVPLDTGDSLFVDERELRRRINPKLGWDKFRATVRLAEKTRSPGGRDFPRFNPLWGGRYWPAVVAYLDDDNRVSEHDAGSTEDGAETFHATARQKTGLQAGAPSPAVLDRQAGGAQPHGVPGRVHRLAARR